MSDRARLLLRDYNTWRDRTNHIQQLRKKHPMRQLGETQERLAVFESMAQWCEEQSLDPRLWLYSLFQTRRWLFAPKLNQLRSPKHIIRYKRLQGTQAFESRVRQEFHQQQLREGGVFDPNRDMSTTTEYRKQRYQTLGLHSDCMHDTECYGFHPRSAVCARCPVARTCYEHLQAQVPFDILSLRKGEMTVEQAQVAAAARRRG